MVRLQQLVASVLGHPVSPSHPRPSSKRDARSESSASRSSPTSARRVADEATQSAVIIDGDDFDRGRSPGRGQQERGGLGERRRFVESPLADRLTIGDTVLERHRRRSVRLIQSPVLRAPPAATVRAARLPLIGFSAALDGVLRRNLLSVIFDADARRSARQSHQDRARRRCDPT